MWIDSHAHVDTFIEDGSWPDIRQRMAAAGVDGLIAIGGSDLANATAMETARAHASVAAVIGYDRDEAGQAHDLEALARQAQEPVVVGIGETGLDYHYSADTATAQCALLEAMLEVACVRSLPVVIHTREAEADTERLLRAYAARWSGASGCPGVIHCYTGGPDFARTLMDLGFMISFSGIVTFKNADLLREALRIVPDDLLLVETDAPYLAPVPMRGKRNEPAFVSHVGEAVARYLDRAPDEIAAITARNVQRLFQWTPIP
jgi:TatD DNase family protein